MVNLDSKIESISPIAKKIFTRLDKLGIKRVSDLLNYYPFRYEDFSVIKEIKDLRPGDIITIGGRVDLIENRRSPVKRKNITEAIISDNSGSIKAVWFNQPFLIRNIKQGERIYLSGKVDVDYNNFQMVGPEYERVSDFTSNTARLVPIYPLTHGVTNKQLRFLIKMSLPAVKRVKDWVPQEIKNNLRLMDLPQALEQIHFPDSSELLNKARVRLKFDELFLIQLQKQAIRNKINKLESAAVSFNEGKIKDFVLKLPFKLTDDQRKAAWAILKDLQKESPMNRLLEGDVGSGKTIVAAIAMLNAALDGKQSAYMAPTEILAKQHFNSIGKLYSEYNVKIGLLTRTEYRLSQYFHTSQYENIGSEIKKRDFLKMVERGEIDILIGTHALIQDKVIFKNLALAVIDEQHRFGVEQRKALTEKSGDKGMSPHYLSMTATPIPRTLHLALYGDLDLSVIKEMPKDRKTVKTKIVEPKERNGVYDFIRSQIKNGRQVFVICPLIDESDKLGVKSVMQEYEKLDKEIFPNLEIGMLHGKLKSKEKEEVMQKFLDNKTKILVATSVVEVGVDVPNATVMLIEGSERFGLAQLHQFRGRVGRSEYQSYCFLFSDSFSESTRVRLEALVECNDGFELAKRDLEFRGYGDVYGKLQSGVYEFKIATLYDSKIISIANEEARKISENDPDLKDYPELKEKMEELAKSVHLE